MSATSSRTLFSASTSWTQCKLAHLVMKFIYLGSIQEEFQLLFFDIDSSHHVFELQFRRNGEEFAEDIEFEITTDQAH